MLLGIYKGRSQELDHESLMSIGPGDKKADNGPYRFIVNALERARSFQRWKRFSWGYRTPGKRLIAAISQKSGNSARVHNGFQSLSVSLVHLLPKFRS